MPDASLPNADRIHALYTAFTAHDGDRMAACYHPDATFTDPVFGTLRGPQVPAMWHMLLARSQGKLTITYSNVTLTGATGHAQWQADYVFSQTGRRVYNRIHATFTFQDGLIHTHTDRFNLWRWATMAFGPMGFFLGWTPFFRRRLRTKVRAALARFQEKQP